MNGTIPAIVSRHLPQAASPLAGAAASPRTGRPEGPETGRSGDRARILELAREFETMMTRQVLRQMRESMLGEDEGGLGAATMTETMDVEVARFLTSGSGTGLAEALRQALERQTAPSAGIIAAPGAGGGAGAGVASLPAARPVPLQQGARAVPLPLPDRISSHFGWREDPLGRGQRFHAGVDIAAAYGRSVQSVADGRVAFAGARPGYGNTILIEHAGGASTRYAHLAAIDVRQGDTISAGDVIGTVGQTGRSTGPHLHFELLQDGRPVNPELAAARYGGPLKNLVAVAD
ncbi:MAG TPA: peptidoglycan DD-metalloendopeptidase family protein [Vicinamibacterales bacterium]|nr:peptidoglycan DD-metalloendopeptidase family protein [Vicinamibacterales bacterium]